MPWYNPYSQQEDKIIENEQRRKGIPEKSSHYSELFVSVIAMTIVSIFLGVLLFLIYI